KSRWDE
nr:Chain C, LYS-SER-ARG-TRP-ASP-GLU [Homo sapiens]5LSO_D Chain D, LYS-SER-ARG-TRP-ASP-GLU [Homo sapiens]